MSKITDLIKKHLSFIIVLCVIIVIDTLIAIAYITDPGFYLPGIPELNPEMSSINFAVFGLSVQTIIFLYVIGFYLMGRWIKTGKKNASTLLWSLAFLLYGIVFVGILLSSFGVEWANMRDPQIFFIWRNFQILWVALMYVGIAKILTESKALQYLPAVIFLALGYLIFSIGLLIIGEINQTFALFLYSFWCPLCSIIAYSFFLYGRKMKITSAKIISIGFTLLGITYMAWAPWYKPEVIELYFFWFFLFNVSLSFILLGYVVMPYEIKAKS
ncbi:MAG: hypothetical protein JW891_02415 [Candidatus Lokiarchaeota archaeon]|nr:hypothetical protein [Candidatus Lokiarchaeota archaeon]